MSKNIEININTGSAYETLLPQTTFANLIDTLPLTSSKLTGLLDIVNKTNGSLPLNRLAEKVASVVKVEYTGTIQATVPDTTLWKYTDDATWFQLVLFSGKNRVPDLVFLVDYDSINYGIFTGITTTSSTYYYKNAFGFRAYGTTSTNTVISWGMQVRKKVKNYTTNTTLNAPTNGMYYSIERGIMINSGNKDSNMFLGSTTQDIICYGFYFS